MFGYLAILQIMSQRTGFNGDRGKPPFTLHPMGTILLMMITSAGEQAAWVLQSHFNYKGDEPRPTSSIPMETRSRRPCLVKTTSVSSKSHTISSGGFLTA